MYAFWKINTVALMCTRVTDKHALECSRGQAWTHAFYVLLLKNIIINVYYHDLK